MNWQKQARLGIAAFVIVFVAIVVVALRQRKTVTPLDPVKPRKDPAAVIENTGTGKITRGEEGKDGFFVLEFGTQFVYADGQNKFGGGVKLTTARNGKPYQVTSREAEILLTESMDLKTAHFMKAVRLTSEGLEVTAEDANYDEAQGLLTVPGPVAFTRGRMKGTGVGATYDRNREVLWLLDQAHITVAADPKGQGALEADAGAAGMARADHYIKLIKNGHINAEGRLIDADEITILLAPGAPEDGGADNDRVQGLQLRGNSRIKGGAGNGPQSMSARDIDLSYAEDGRTLQHAQLMEEGVLQMPGDGKKAGQRIAGKTIDIALAPDGATVTNLNATENVQVDIPPDGDLPAKRIRSATLTASGAAGGGLQNATFNGNVDYRETRAARGNLPAVDRAARSLSLVVKTKPGFGALEQADFHGNVHFTDGPQVAADATLAVYHVDRDQIELSPTDDPGPPAPRVSDGRVTVEARTIEMVLATRKLKADTKVRSSMLPQQKPAAPASGRAAPGGAAPRGTAPAGSGRGAAPAQAPAAPAPAAAADQQAHLPSLLKQDQVVTVTSNRMEYDGAVGHAVYNGNARLWQGDTSVRGDTIIVDDKTGNLEAHLNVLTDFMIDEMDPQTKERTTTRTKGDADHFLYEDARRLATYTDKAHVVGPDGDITAQKLELFLKPDSNELDRAEGYGENGTVIVKQVGTRIAKGARLTYTPGTATYRMTGTPVEALEIAPNDCKQSFGAVMTFQRAAGTGDMQGNGVIRTSQNKIACPAGTQ